MNLQCEIELVGPYKSKSQIARVLTEAWCGRELYCPACDSDRLTTSRANTQAVDFECPQCDQPFQLKSLRRWNPKKVVDAGYEAMLRAIRADKTPNLLVLQYSDDWLVKNLLLVPKVFFTESIVEKRTPLSVGARRAGWVGCNILLGEIPLDGKIALISSGQAIPKAKVREEFSRIRGLAELPPSLRGWTLDVLGLIRQLDKPCFSLRELYRFEPELKAIHPGNQNIRPKIRQQLQVLRDLGMLEFLTPGNYLLRG
jgi:type II restriction enzyme